MSRPTVLVVNAGSSSIKLRLLDGDDRLVATTDLAADRHGFDEAELRAFLHGGRPDVVGHRVVHGGRRFRRATLVDADVRAALEDLTVLAPLHQPAALSGIDHVRDVLPDVPSVACFDTTFHVDLPDAAATYALPREWLQRWPIRRYGFHGLSHAYASRRVAQLLGRDVADLCAVDGGRSVDTTMGFTPLEGLVMATRSGSIDPGLVLWLQQQGGLSADEVEEGLEHHAGLLGLGGTSDLRELLDDPCDDDARLALAVYVHRIAGSVAAMTASLGGLDALVFTAGVGEHSVPVRRLVAERLEFLGVALDPAANATVDGDADVSAQSARVRSVVLEAREDLQIARECRAALASS